GARVECAERRAEADGDRQRRSSGGDLEFPRCGEAAAARQHNRELQLFRRRALQQARYYARGGGERVAFRAAGEMRLETYALELRELAVERGGHLLAEAVAIVGGKLPH